MVKPILIIVSKGYCLATATSSFSEEERQRVTVSLSSKEKEEATPSSSSTASVPKANMSADDSTINAGSGTTKSTTKDKASVGDEPTSVAAAEQEEPLPKKDDDGLVENDASKLLSPGEKGMEPAKKVGGERVGE